MQAAGPQSGVRSRERACASPGRGDTWTAGSHWPCRHRALGRNSVRVSEAGDQPVGSVGQLWENTHKRQPIPRAYLGPASWKRASQQASKPDLRHSLLSARAAAAAQPFPKLTDRLHKSPLRRPREKLERFPFPSKSRVVRASHQVRFARFHRCSPRPQPPAAPFSDSRSERELPPIRPFKSHQSSHTACNES